MQTKLPETDDYKASDTVSQTVSTLVTVSGTVTAQTGEDAATPALPATLVITDSKDSSKTYTVTTDANGSYSIDLPPGSYSVAVTGKDGLQEGSGSLSVSGTSGITASTIAMTNSDKGNAKVFADKYLTKADGNYMTSLDDVDESTISKLLSSESAYEKLSDEVKAEIDKLVAPTTYLKLVWMAEINKKVADAKDEIAEAVAAGALTEEDEKTLSDLLDAAADKAKSGLNDAEDTKGVLSVYGQFDEDYDLISAKARAAVQINEDVQKAKDSVNALKNLNDEDKQKKLDEIDAASKTAKDSVNAATDETGVNGALDTLTQSLKDITDRAAAEDFTEGYLTDDSGNIISDINSGTIDSILGARDAYDALTTDQKAIVDAMISNATGGEFASYDELEKAAEDAAQKGAEDFIKKHMTLNDSTITSVSPQTYGNILGGEDDWNKLSQAEKDAINAQLKVAGATQTYEEMLASVEAAVEESATSFISKYVSDSNGNIYTKATRDNYAQILSGQDAWNALSQAEKDAINAKLVANGGKTYEGLLASAQSIQKQVEAEKAAKAKKSSTGKTGDVLGMAVPIALAVAMVAAAAGGYALSRRPRGKHVQR